MFYFPFTLPTITDDVQTTTIDTTDEYPAHLCMFTLGMHCLHRKQGILAFIVLWLTDGFVMYDVVTL